MTSIDFAIVGAGIMGLAVAYNLAKTHGITNTVVVDKSYLCGGASGRNGGGVRAQFSSEENIRLMQESIRICRDFARELRINVWFRQGGYLFIVRSEERRRRSDGDGTTTGERRGDERGRPDWRERMREAGAN